MKDSSPNLNGCHLWVKKLVAKKEFKDKDGEHQDELWSVSKLTIEDLVSHHNNLVEDYQKHQIHGSPICLLLRNTK